MNEMNLMGKNYEQFNIWINEMQFSFYHEKNENNKTRTKKEQQKMRTKHSNIHSSVIKLSKISVQKPRKPFQIQS